MRKAFTMVELLTVMAIVAILTGFGMAYFAEATLQAHINNMRVDAKKNIEFQETFYALNKYYDEIPTTSYSNSNLGGLRGNDGNKFSVSEDNILFVEAFVCDTGIPGYRILISSDTVTHTAIEFNKCEDGAIHEVVI
ncbi:MAG: prepilin-type N-terminal cleavage/methylation domain-containing protein [Sulfuricurvum sp.]|jgi:prepilin-type N-terminal cleavage/methylation domain-containing protein|uniref:type IV pilin protein n=1 Tax=Sulfuricurvum sp. TaxID=2025608 RepID=UPI0025EE9BAD|nr:prepilin-type N-terminal cleavage/methylation domain-containing protein [Sulfuricurvum sp.]MCK9372446.1 prepilin-type N-terminal cleavage/methylation domain-containing protein [Sulfuricurvum sp.]